ncbi:MAG: hypothetical protein WC489_06320 [Patescibacteria group bacterium]
MKTLNRLNPPHSSREYSQMNKWCPSWVVSTWARFFPENLGCEKMKRKEIPKLCKLWKDDGQRKPCGCVCANRPCVVYRATRKRIRRMMAELNEE